MGRDPLAPPVPGSVRAARILLFVAAGLGVLVFVVVASLGFPARVVGAVAMGPLLHGLAGVVLAARIGPGRRGVRVAIIVLESLWAVLSFGGLTRDGAPVAALGLVLAIAVLALVNTRAARDYFRSRISGEAHR